ncbi:MAG TPA: hypothetical protein VH308_04880, partial [Terracidiphilus sp.]|nr:hypothetical protein [Terracidiphilus sp.]
LEQMPDPEFDLLLRSALATYAEPASDSELVHGILVRVAAESAPAPVRRWLPWAIALPVAAGLLALAFLFGSRQMHIPARNENQAHISQQPLHQQPAARTEPSSAFRPTPIQRAKARGPRPQPRGVLVTAQPAPLPKLAVFPTPRPLSAEEQALVDYTAQAPENERRKLIEAQKKLEAPLNIAEIEIQPLDPPDQGGN